MGEIAQGLPEPLTDVIGLVSDEDGITPMLVFRRADGRWLASQAVRDIELPVIAWAPLPPVPAHLALVGAGQ